MVSKEGAGRGVGLEGYGDVEDDVAAARRDCGKGRGEVVNLREKGDGKRAGGSVVERKEHVNEGLRVDGKARPNLHPQPQRSVPDLPCVVSQRLILLVPTEKTVSSFNSATVNGFSVINACPLRL